LFSHSSSLSFRRSFLHFFPFFFLSFSLFWPSIDRLPSLPVSEDKRLLGKQSLGKIPVLPVAFWQKVGAEIFDISLHNSKTAHKKKLTQRIPIRTKVKYRSVTDKMQTVFFQHKPVA